MSQIIEPPNIPRTKVTTKIKSSFEALQKLEDDYLRKGVFPTTPSSYQNDSWFAQWVRSMARMRSRNLGSMRNAEFRQAWDGLVEKYIILFDEDDESERRIFAKVVETRRDVTGVD
jgi:hypothetical protein